MNVIKTRTVSPTRPHALAKRLSRSNAHATLPDSGKRAVGLGSVPVELWSRGCVFGEMGMNPYYNEVDVMVPVFGDVEGHGWVLSTKFGEGRTQSTRDGKEITRRTDASG